MKHYLQVTDDDFQRASKSGAQSGAFSGVDLELVAVIQAWAELSKEVQQQIMVICIEKTNRVEFG